MYRVIRSVLIFSLVAVFVGCEYWNKDMLGYLEYWSSTVQVGRVDKSGAEFQKNNDGIDTIPVAATPTITAVLINPKGFGLDVTKGTSSGSSVIIDNANVASLVETPVLSDKNALLSVRLKPGDESLEHQTFTLTFEPVRTDNKLAVPGQSITLRYNTPPAAPMPVVKTETGYELVPSGAKWEASEGKLYWAYYDEQDEKKPNCAKYFKVGDNLKSLDECLDSNATISGSNYKVFYAQTGSASTSVAAVDSEGITGAAIVSGQVAPAPITYTITYDANEDYGIEPHVVSGNVPLPQDCTQGLSIAIVGATLTRVGYIFGGWNTQSDGLGTTYQVGGTVSFTGDTTLYAKWVPMTQYYVSQSSGSDATSNDGSRNKPFQTIGRALHFINQFNNGTQSFIIHVEGTFEAKQEDVSDKHTSVVNIEPGQKLTLTIQGKDGQTATINANNHGRVMYVDANANVTLKNIELIGGVVNGFGGGVYIAGGGSLTLSTGATISGNTGNFIGGGVYSDGTLIMETGSSIKNNTANDQGGGVFINNGEFNMTGGTINGNTVTNGNGGGVFVKDTASTFTMSDNATISGNAATDGGGVYSTGILTMSGGTINGNTATNGCGVYNDGTFTMSGSSTVDANNDVYLPSGKTITVNSALTGSFPVATITPQTYTSSTQVLSGSRVHKEFGLFKVTEDSSGRKWGVAATGMLLQYTSATNATNVLQNLVDGKSVSFDMTSDTPFTPLDSYANIGNFSPGKDYAIYVPEDTTLVINGNNNFLKEAVRCGDLLKVKGTLVLNDVKITGANLHWSVIEVLDGAMVILNNCIIENNNDGGGTGQGVISIMKGGTAIMNGGKIEGNYLAGVTVEGEGSFTIKGGGVIQNNQKGGVRKEANATYVNEGGTVDKVEDY